MIQCRNYLSLALLFVLVFFFSVLFSIVIKSRPSRLRKRELVYVLLFVYFARVNFCPFPFPLGVSHCKKKKSEN